MLINLRIQIVQTSHNPTQFLSLGGLLLTCGAHSFPKNLINIKYGPQKNAIIVDQCYFQVVCHYRKADRQNRLNFLLACQRKIQTFYPFTLLSLYNNLRLYFPFDFDNTIELSRHPKEKVNKFPKNHFGFSQKCKLPQIPLEQVSISDFLAILYQPQLFQLISRNSPIFSPAHSHLKPPWTQIQPFAQFFIFECFLTHFIRLQYLFSMTLVPSCLIIFSILLSLQKLSSSFFQLVLVIELYLPLNFFILLTEYLFSIRSSFHLRMNFDSVSSSVIYYHLSRCRINFFSYSQSSFSLFSIIQSIFSSMQQVPIKLFLFLYKLHFIQFVLGHIFNLLFTSFFAIWFFITHIRLAVSMHYFCPIRHFRTNFSSQLACGLLSLLGLQNSLNLSSYQILQYLQTRIISQMILAQEIA